MKKIKEILDEIKNEESSEKREDLIKNTSTYWFFYKKITGDKKSFGYSEHTEIKNCALNCAIESYRFHSNFSHYKNSENPDKLFNETVNQMIAECKKRNLL